MAYFSNGTECMQYQFKYCDKCVHDKDQGCTVWLLHLLYAYEECNNDGENGPQTNAKAMLDALIPMNDCHFADKCSMFIEDKTQ